MSGRVAGHLLSNNDLAVELGAAGTIEQVMRRASGRALRGDALPAQSWKLVVLTDGYPVRHVWGSAQHPDTVEAGADRVSFTFSSVIAQHSATGGERSVLPIGVRYTVGLDGDEVWFGLEVDNRHTHRIREAWCPVLTAVTGWDTPDGPDRLDVTTSDLHQRDVLHHRLAGQEYIFNADVLRETAHYTYPRKIKSQWIDVSGPDEGWLLTSRDTSLITTSFRVEKAPAEFGDFTGTHHMPPGTPHFLNLAVARLTSIEPGTRWSSARSVLHPHAGDWHAAAHRYGEWIRSVYTWADRPAWLSGFTGFQHLLGKTHLDEVYFPFPRFADTFAQTTAQDKINVLMTYGHETRGCESADFSIRPADDLGGADGFRAMAEAVHADGGRVMIMTHRHAALATDDPATQRFADWLIVDREGRPRQEIWPKTTLESFGESMLRTYEASGPIWQRVCVFCDEWWSTFRDELIMLIDLGLDGVQMDLMVDEAPICYAEDHGHVPGAPEQQLRKLGERLAWLREQVRAAHPDFALMGEEYADWLYQYLDVSFSRYHDGIRHRIFGYTFPELAETCSVGHWAYDQIGKALMTGRGLGVEVFEIKDSILAIPAFHAYLAACNRLRLELADLLMRGGFVDHDGVRMTGEVSYGVHRTAAGTAVVVANETDSVQSCRILDWPPEDLVREEPGRALVREEPGRALVREEPGPGPATDARALAVHTPGERGPMIVPVGAELTVPAHRLIVITAA